MASLSEDSMKIQVTPGYLTVDIGCWPSSEIQRISYVEGNFHFSSKIIWQLGSYCATTEGSRIGSLFL